MISSSEERRSGTLELLFKRDYGGVKAVEGHLLAQRNRPKKYDDKWMKMFWHYD